MRGSFELSNMNAHPLVTMVVPSYNHGLFVQACIESIVSQEYQNIELIVIDDGSVDDSVVRIEEMATRCRARFCRFEFRARSNKGLCETLNEALEWGNGIYFAVLDSDDVLLPNKTSVLVSQIERNPDLAGVFGGCVVIDPLGNVLSITRPQATKYSFSNILARNKMFVSSCMLVKLQMVRHVGGYPKGLYIEDWYMWLKLTEYGSELMVIPEPLVLYRQHASNISKDVFKMHNSRMEIAKLFLHCPETKLTMAKICLETSIEFSQKSKSSSIGYILQALKYHPIVLLRWIFWNSVARMLMPFVVLKVLKRLWNTTRGS